MPAPRPSVPALLRRRPAENLAETRRDLVEGKNGQRGEYGFAFANGGLLTLFTGLSKQKTNLSRRQTQLDRRPPNARPGPTTKRLPGESWLRVRERSISDCQIPHRDTENESSSDSEAPAAPTLIRMTRSRKIVAR
jgi:hypothetical protein